MTWRRTPQLLRRTAPPAGQPTRKSTAMVACMCLVSSSLAAALWVGAGSTAASGQVEQCLGKNATKVGGPNNDDLFGGAGQDVITAKEGNDRVEGNVGADTLCGDLGNDDRVDGIDGGTVTTT